MPRHVKKGDMVEVITGDHKGETGKVLRVDVKRDRVVVEGVNMIYRHVRPSRRNPQGGRLRREAPIHISNVLPLDSKTNHGARVRYEVKQDAQGKVVSKRRVTVHGTVLGEVTRASDESAPRTKKGGAAR
jgi:large subunit ribosomal protein L24